MEFTHNSLVVIYHFVWKISYWQRYNANKLLKMQPRSIYIQKRKSTLLQQTILLLIREKQVTEGRCIYDFLIIWNHGWDKWLPYSKLHGFQNKRWESQTSLDTHPTHELSRNQTKPKHTKQHKQESYCPTCLLLETYKHNTGSDIWNFWKKRMAWSFLKGKKYCQCQTREEKSGKGKISSGNFKLNITSTTPLSSFRWYNINSSPRKKKLKYTVLKQE